MMSKIKNDVEVFTTDELVYSLETYIFKYHPVKTVLMFIVLFTRKKGGEFYAYSLKNT